MAVYYNTENLPIFTKAVVTIGTFDGVHLGHRAIINEVVNHAKQIGGESVLLTFEPHPRKILFPDKSIKLITPLQDKIELLSCAGVQHIVVVPFTRDFSNLSAEAYISDFLVRKFQPESIVIGYDHHFGHDRSGNIKLLRKYAAAYNYRVDEIPAQLIDNATVSSTMVRDAIAQGNVREANEMLGWHFSVSGNVISGARLGRTIGYPTANILPLEADQLIPANGVYAILVTWKGNTYRAMLNIGTRPTVSNELKLHIEAHIFDFDTDIYEQDIKLTFIERIRDEVKFPSIESLRLQLDKDKETALELLEKF